MLSSNLCDYSDAYIIVKGRTSVRGTNDANKINTNLTFKKSVPFRSCILKFNNAFVENTEDLDIAMSMCNLFEYSSNSSMTSGNLCNYYRDEVNDSANEIDDNESKFFKYRI